MTIWKVSLWIPSLEFRTKLSTTVDVAFESLTGGEAETDQTAWEDLEQELVAELAEGVQQIHTFTHYHHHVV
jgi:hypothetical protein